MAISKKWVDGEQKKRQRSPLVIQDLFMVNLGFFSSWKSYFPNDQKQLISSFFLLPLYVSLDFTNLNIIKKAKALSLCRYLSQYAYKQTSI